MLENLTRVILFYLLVCLLQKSQIVVGVDSLLADTAGMTEQSVGFSTSIDQIASQTEDVRSRAGNIETAGLLERVAKQRQDIETFNIASSLEELQQIAAQQQQWLIATKETIAEIRLKIQFFNRVRSKLRP